jgi:hypothetical protein
VYVSVDVAEEFARGQKGLDSIAVVLGVTGCGLRDSVCPFSSTQPLVLTLGRSLNGALARLRCSSGTRRARQRTSLFSLVCGVTMVHKSWLGSHKGSRWLAGIREWVAPGACRVRDCEAPVGGNARSTDIPTGTSEFHDSSLEQRR